MMGRSLVVLGVRIDRVNMAQALTRIERFIEEGDSHRVVTVNLDTLRHSQRAQQFQEALNSADLAVADGAPLLWASRLFGKPLSERVTGVDMAERCAELAAAKGYRLFLLGAAPGVAQATARILTQKYPGLPVVETYTPPLGEFPPEEEERIAERLRRARPDVLLVALSTPRLELWNHRHAGEWGVPVTIGVGAAFDMLSGRVRRAPRWMQRAGLEWLFRLWLEPRRLWRRYLLHDLPVLAQLIRSGLAFRWQSAVYRARSVLWRGRTGEA
jgi:N-acetylglucosaminyldiphosphoundecaprenol N-acetyl-beta-D-mannosaminyltransferase